MLCNQCGQNNQENSKFCVKCGASLVTGATAEVNPPFFNYAQQGQPEQPEQPEQPGQPGQPNQPNPQLQQIKQVSSQYLSHFLQVLKNPTRMSESTNASHMVNGIITMVLFSLMLPLIVYFTLKRIWGGFGFEHISFGTYVLKPLVFLFLVIMMVNTLIFFALKLGNVVLGYRDVIARFGANMIPSTAIMIVGFLLSLMKADGEFLSWIMLAGIFSWILAVVSTIYSYRNRLTGGLDPFYGVLGTFAGSALLLYLFGDNLLSVFFDGMGNIL